MRFLVLGSSGMAGHVISRYLCEHQHEVTGFSRHPGGDIPVIVGDARCKELLAEIVVNGGCDVVVNAIGILNANAEKDEPLARYLNGELPHLLADLVSDLPTRIIHMSTDCVFAGNGGPYTEQSLPDGLSVYDRTKAQGELKDKKNLTLRNSIVGPDCNIDGIGLFNWFMKQTGEIEGYTRAMWTGMTTIELSRAIEHAALAGDAGLVNMVPAENISKYDLLLLFKKYFSRENLRIKPSARLALDKTLVRTNFESAFRPKSYEEQVADMAVWVKEHAGLYPHYNLGAMLDE